MLTDTALRNLKPKSKPYKASDRDGMYVTVSTTGTVTFRYDYRLNGRRETLTIGRYGPSGISLAMAREKLIDAKKAVAQFREREGMPSAFMVTLRRDHMWHFMDRLINLAIPRIKDFRGVKDKSFDKGGSYSMGLTEQAVWPEINMANATITHGMHITFVFENSNPKMSRFVLAELGMPFVKPEERKKKN